MSEQNAQMGQKQERGWFTVTDNCPRVGLDLPVQLKKDESEAGAESNPDWPLSPDRWWVKVQQRYSQRYQGYIGMVAPPYKHCLQLKHKIIGFQ